MKVKTRMLAFDINPTSSYSDYSILYATGCIV